MRVEVIGDATLILGDCREVLPTLSGVDAVVTDPPYGMGWDGKITSGRNTTSATKPGSKTRHYGVTIVGDDAEFDPSPLTRWRCIIWGANHFFSKLEAGGILVWVKRYDDAFGSYLSDAEVAWFNFGRGVYCFRNVGDFRGKLPGGAPLPKWHPNQKPVELMAWCISKVGGETIADPYMGSGTTGIACARLGRRFVGVEIDPTYFDIACRRIEQAQRQRDLFIDAPPAEDPADTRMADLFAEPEE